MDNLLVKRSKVNAAFLIIRVKLAKKRQNLYSRILSVEVELRLAPFVIYRNCVSCFWLCTSGKFNQS